MTEQMTLEQAIATMAACAYKKDAEGIVDAWEVIKAHLNAAKGEAVASGEVGRIVIEPDARNQWGKSAHIWYAEGCMDLPVGNYPLYTHPSSPDVVVAQEPSNDREALIYLMDRFDTEEWECRCGRTESTKDMDSAIFLREYLHIHPSSPDVVRDADLLAFHDYFRDRCEALFNAFGMEAIDLYNAAAMAAREGGE